jgi:hypothetical protein
MKGGWEDGERMRRWRGGRGGRGGKYRADVRRTEE